MSRPRRTTPGPGGKNRRPKLAGHGSSRDPQVQGTASDASTGPKRRSDKRAGGGSGRHAAGRGALAGVNTRLLSATIIVGAIAIASAIVLAVVHGPSALRGQPESDGIAFVDQAATTEVENRTKEALAAVFSYDYRTLDDDFDRALSFLTEDMQDEYRQTIDATRQAAEQRQATVEMAIRHAGVHALSNDEAELLALSLVSTEYDDVPGEMYSGPLRVVLKKVDGDWLIDSIDER
ncbi:hypothetical protein [Hoyosella subflava]|uniref:Hypothetical membrane protein n=1 Tax=Hoyosella subflava (strain DSM 45089 / JCM 17490 / NBRC 109087 / DQS3-9A1) TaxID=443218 RepID=F6EHT8_HOYSD|nr:hypothetical protein [Hoyosella subflava]AEF38886.1 Hypothetical membrane protein [Hoyosella subflava DQS3-9A1]